MILLIDNYDSFTYNLVQRIGEFDPNVDLRVVRNDQISLDEIAGLRPDRLIISPGPCTPNEAGISVACVQRFAGQLPILGVCLGHQSIGQAFGARIVLAEQLMHGKTDHVFHDDTGLFHGLPNPLIAHSISQPGDRARIVAGLPGSQRLDRAARRRTRDHGDSPSGMGGVRSAVPPRKLSDGGRTHLAAAVCHPGRRSAGRCAAGSPTMISVDEALRILRERVPTREARQHRRRTRHSASAWLRMWSVAATSPPSTNR